MDPEAKQLIEKTYSLVEENNKKLRRMRRSQKVTSIMRVVYWLIIIGIAIGAFYFLQPYIDKLEKFLGSTGISIDQLKGLTNLPR